jgi:hypothetical protein
MHGIADDRLKQGRRTMKDRGLRAKSLQMGSEIFDARGGQQHGLNLESGGRELFKHQFALREKSPTREAGGCGIGGSLGVVAGAKPGVFLVSVRGEARVIEM